MANNGVELVWDGKRKEVERVALPFQRVEIINESRATRRTTPLFSTAAGPQLPPDPLWAASQNSPEPWRNKLIWGDNKYVLASLLEGDPTIGLESLAGKVDLIYIDPAFATGADFSFTATVGDIEGGVADDQVVGDVAGSMQFLRSQHYASGKVGVIGFCSGRRHTYLVACRLADVDAAVDCWGGGVIVDDPAQLNDKRPVAVIDLTPQLSCPLLGIFGNEDRNPDVHQVNRTEEALQHYGKTYEFHRYDGAGHGFFAVDRPGYRLEQATDAWGKVFAFYEKYLGIPVAQTVAR